LDAVPYLFEREGTSCENLPETHDFLKKLRRHVDKKFKDRMLLAEANQWPEDAVAYFGDGDECHMAFHFPIMPRLYMALRMEDSFPVFDILEQTPAIPSSCQWAIFLRNHDELTLEMVTDEERDYMWRAYAAEPQMRINVGIRRRLAPLLENNRRRIELMNALLFSLPGTPVLYYGDEIGMGDNVYLGDRNGVRTPMQWSPDRNAGFSDANPQKLFLPPIVDPEYNYETINVETQQQNPSSLLWWTKRIIALRKQHQAFGRGSFEPLLPENRKVLAFVRRYEDEAILVVANLSRFSQYVELDLSEFRGQVPVEMFGNARFAPIDEAPYRLTLGPHNFFWFSLKPAHQSEVAVQDEEPLPELEARGGWEAVLERRGSNRPPIERALPRYLRGRRWFRSKARNIKHVRVLDAIPLASGKSAPRLVLAEVQFGEGDPETYALAVDFASEYDDHALAQLVVRDRRAEHWGYLVDVSEHASTAELLLAAATRRRRLKGDSRVIVGRPGPELTALKGESLPARALGVEQSNTSFVYGDIVVAKLLRRVEDGTSLELEVLSHLGERAQEVAVPPLLGHLEIRDEDDNVSTLAVFQRFVPNHGDAWSSTVDEVERYFERVLMGRLDLETPPRLGGSALDLVSKSPSAEVSERLAGFPELARRLGARTANLHLALASAAEDSPFSPDNFTSLSRRSYYQSVRNLAARSFDLLRQQLKTLEPVLAEQAKATLKLEREVRARLKRLIDEPIPGKRIRVHGDFHLGQVLNTGMDFAIIDFEGEPARSFADRRRRRSPLADVAGMLRSFHYAVFGVLGGDVPGSAVRPSDVPLLEPWASTWYTWVSAAFLSGYLDVIDGSGLLPESREELAALLDVYLLEKTLYELSYELNNRPAWVGIPLRGLSHVLGSDGAA
jgi:maltose alpha-D-glucosyltransferase/alpha-amylase